MPRLGDGHQSIFIDIYMPVLFSQNLLQGRAALFLEVKTMASCDILRTNDVWISIHPPVINHGN